VTANVTAAIQVKPGIGDVVWHLPFHSRHRSGLSAKTGDVLRATDERRKGFARRGTVRRGHGLFSACRIGIAAQH
jgi:hypothetical protein